MAQRKRVGLITQRSEDRNLPPLFLFGRVRFPNVKALVAQLAALRSYEPVAQGSSPCRSSFLAYFEAANTAIIYSKPLWRSWQRVGLIIPRSWVRNPPEALLIALVAQLAALRSYEPMVQGSSPCRSRFL